MGGEKARWRYLLVSKYLLAPQVGRMHAHEMHAHEIHAHGEASLLHARESHAHEM